MASFAERQLQKYGWQKGKGLGKREDGRVDIVKVAVKNDQRGIGVGSDQWSFNWWDHAFNKACSTIQVETTESGVAMSAQQDLSKQDIITTTRPTSSSQTSSKDLVHGLFVKQGDAQNEDFHGRDFSSNITDEELFRRCGGRTAHKGARSTMNGKLRRASAIGLGLPSVHQTSSSDEEDSHICETHSLETDQHEAKSHDAPKTETLVHLKEEKKRKKRKDGTEKKKKSKKDDKEKKKKRRKHKHVDDGSRISKNEEK